MTASNTELREADERRTPAALALVDALAAYVLDGEPCPERCTCGSEDGTHEDPSSGDMRDALSLFVWWAREALREADTESAS